MLPLFAASKAAHPCIASCADSHLSLGMFNDAADALEQLCFLGAEERNRALHGERQPVPINAYNIGADEHESHFGSSQNLF